MADSADSAPDQIVPPSPLAWDGACDIKFARTGRKEVKFTVPEIANLVATAYDRAIERIKQRKGEIMPCIESVYAPLLSAKNSVQEQPDLEYIKVQMKITGGQDKSEAYLARWVLIADELKSHIKLKEEMVLLQRFKDSYIKDVGRVGSQSAVEVTLSSAFSDTTSLIHIPLNVTLITQQKKGGHTLEKVQIANLDKLTKDLSSLIQKLQEFGQTDLCHKKVEYTISKCQVEPIEGVEAAAEKELKLKNLISSLFDHCRNKAFLQNAFLYTSVGNRVISILRNGLYVDDVGYSIDVQMGLSKLFFDSSTTLNLDQYIKKIGGKVCREISKSGGIDKEKCYKVVRAYFRKNVINGRDMVARVNDFISSRQKFGDDRLAAEDLVVKNIIGSFPLIQEELDTNVWSSRMTQFDTYAMEFAEAHSITKSSNVNESNKAYKTYFEALNIGEVSLLKSPLSIFPSGSTEKAFTVVDLEDRERYKGPSYPDFAKMFYKSKISSFDMVSSVRKILTCEDCDISQCLFLPCFVTTLFLAEVARFPRMVLSSLMVLDMIEHSSGSDRYSLSRCFYLENFENMVKDGTFSKEELQAQDMFGNLKQYQLIGGRYPMANLDSANLNPYGTPSLKKEVSLQKEVSMTIDWLELVFNGTSIQVSTTKGLCNALEHEKVEDPTKTILEQILVDVLLQRALTVCSLQKLDLSQFSKRMEEALA